MTGNPKIRFSVIEQILKTSMKEQHYINVLTFSLHFWVTWPKIKKSKTAIVRANVLYHHVKFQNSCPVKMGETEICNKAVWTYLWVTCAKIAKSATERFCGPMSSFILWSLKNFRNSIEERRTNGRTDMSTHFITALMRNDLNCIRNDREWCTESHLQPIHWTIVTRYP